MKHLLVLLFAATVWAADPADAVKQAEKDWATGVKTADTALLTKVLGDDLIYTHSNGATDTKATYVEGIRTGRLKYLVADHESMDVRLYGNMAVLTGKINVKTVNNGQETPAKLVILHVYAKRKGNWELVAHQSARLP